MKCTRSVAWAKPPAVAVKAVSPLGGSPRSASTFRTSASASWSSTAASSSRVAPTHVRWAIASMPNSRLIRDTSSIVRARVLPPAP
jgi:hypothetical protein